MSSYNLKLLINKKNKEIIDNLLILSKGCYFVNLPNLDCLFNYSENWNELFNYFKHFYNSEKMHNMVTTSFIKFLMMNRTKFDEGIQLISLIKVCCYLYY